MITRGTVSVGIWWGCYRQKWGAELVPDALSHPAKFSPGLIGRIYRHGLKEGYAG